MTWPSERGSAATLDQFLGWVGIRRRLAIGKGEPMTKDPVTYELVITEATENEMDPDAVGHVLALLTCWALRKARTPGHGARGERDKGVSIGFSKGSGSQEAAQLTCYGPTKR